jgi:trehalose 6-phosphate phosphatase
MPETGPDPEAAPRPPPLGRSDALFLDFDGTIVELAPTPETVRVGPGLPDLLTALSQRLAGAVAIVSGRRLADIARLLAPYDGAMIGLHGGEIRKADGTIERRSADPAILPSQIVLTDLVARHPEIMIEDKGSSIALHYRKAPHLAGACREAARDLVAASGGALRAIDGNRVVELVPQCVGKGTAIAVLAAEPPFRGRLPVFVGDDTTDEDGFLAVEAMGGITVKVGPGASVARCRLATVADVMAWLSR